MDVSDMPGVLGVLLVLVVMVAGVAFGHLHHQRRVRELTTWAHQYGWSYATVGRHGAGRVQMRDPIRNQAIRVGHALWGTHRGHEVTGVQFTLGSGKHRTTYQAVQVRTPGWTPWLQVSREHLGHKLLAQLGVHDLQLSDPRFNDAFRVHTDSDEFTRHVLHPHLMDWMLRHPRALRGPVRFDGDHVLTWRTGTLDPPDMLGEADFLIDLLSQVPPYVWHTRAPHQ